MDIKQTTKKYFFDFAFLITFIIGIAARFDNLTKTSLWYDEAFSGLLIRQDWGSMMATIIKDRVHPPLYYALLKIFSGIFGYTDVAMRSFSLIFGILLIASTYFVLSKIVNKKAGLIGAILVAASPFFITYSLEARSYIMLCFLASILIYVFWKLWQEINAKVRENTAESKNLTSNQKIKAILKSRIFIIFLVVALLMLATHYLSILLIAFCFGLVFLKFIEIKWPKLIRWGKKYAPMIVLLGIFFALIAITLLHIDSLRIISKDQTLTKWLPDGKLSDFLRLGYAYLFGVERESLASLTPFVVKIPFSFDEINLIWASLLTIGVTYFIIKKDQIVKFFTMILVLPLGIIYIAALLGLNVIFERYLMIFGLIFIYLISILLSKINFKYAIGAILIYIVLLFNVQWTFVNPDYRGAAEKIVAREKDYSRIVADSPFDYLVLKFYINNRTTLYILDHHDPSQNYRYWPFVENVLDTTDSNDWLLPDLYQKGI